MNPQQFFGGAIECHVPVDWRDISDVRQVPDNQECWQSANGELLVMEILDRETNIPDDEAALYFFRDLAEANGISSQDGIEFETLAEIPRIASDLPADAALCGGKGRQFVAQGRDTDIAGNPRQLQPKWVRIDLCVIRLLNVNAEILVTLTSPDSSGRVPSENIYELFVEILRSIRIVDWNLFG